MFKKKDDKGKQAGFGASLAEALANKELVRKEMDEEEYNSSFQDRKPAAAQKVQQAAQPREVKCVGCGSFIEPGSDCPYCGAKM